MSTKQKTTTNQTVTATPTNPQWVTDTNQGLAGMIQGLAGQDPQSFVAGPSGLQNQGFDLFSQLGGQAGGWMGQAAQMAQNPAAQMTAANPGDAAQAQASTAAQNMGAYFNPYESQVIDASMGDLNRARMLTQNGNGQGAQIAGQYGSNRQGVLDANADDSFLRNAGSMAANLRHQGFTTAAGLGDSDASRMTGTSQFNAGQTNTMAALKAQLEQQAALANQGATNNQNQFGASMLGNLGQFGAAGLMDAGATQQGIAQNQAGAPLNLLQMLSGANGAMPYGLFNGSTQNMNGTSTGKTSGLGAWAQGIGGVLQGVGSVGQAFAGG